MKRRFNFIPAAPRMVRIDLAVRPFLPITLPKSLGATFRFQHRDLFAFHYPDGNIIGNVNKELWQCPSTNCFMRPASYSRMVTRTRHETVVESVLCHATCRSLFHSYRAIHGLFRPLSPRLAHSADLGGVTLGARRGEPPAFTRSPSP